MTKSSVLREFCYFLMKLLSCNVMEANKALKHRTILYVINGIHPE